MMRENVNKKFLLFSRICLAIVALIQIGCTASNVTQQPSEKDNVINQTPIPKTGEAETAKGKDQKISTELLKKGDSKEAKQKLDKPKIVNEVLDFDFAVLEHGKSQLTVAMQKKPRYDIKRKNAKTVILTIEEVTIAPLLQRRIDSSHFGGAVDRVESSFSPANNRFSLFVSLKEIVPFHVDYIDRNILIDFGPTSIEPQEKKVILLKSAKEQKSSLKSRTVDQKAVTDENAGTPSLEERKYEGTPMTMDFVNADVTNILRLIGEVSNLNIVWGPEVKGKVSMRLKSVPWDQALDLIMANNDLVMRPKGNVVWVTTRQKFTEIETEIGAQRKMKLEAQKEAKELEPLITEYFPLDFASAEDCKKHVSLSERGSVTVDARTNTIIMKDIASNIEESRKIIARFDAPVKQIMIEARIVDAGTEFSRDLGIKWESVEAQKRNTKAVPWEGTPLWKPYKETDPESSDNWPSIGGAERYGGSFSSNAPEDWIGNIGLNFATLTGGALGAFGLDASLALAESEEKVKIISAPKVIASNGEKAVISRGDIIYKEIVTADTIDIKELPATLSLTVIPTVSFNDYVTMKIELTDDKVYQNLTGKTEKSIETTLMVKSGETVVIGGIYKEDSSESESGFPWLRDIPILGWLFKAQKKYIKKSELLIFITPTVIKISKKE
ncbi:MAG: type IV pilus secretin PilQ [Deltaproteobacteria bacterium]|nr:type IV pilus secretin PilQ [Deltaproteobacteria bacterium]